MGRRARLPGGVVLTSVSRPMSLDSCCASTTSRLPRLNRSAAASTSWARLCPTSRACREGIRRSGLLSLLLGVLDPLLLRAKLEIFNNQDQSRHQIVITDASSWYGHISAHVRTLVLLLGIPSLSVSCAPSTLPTLSSFLGPACWCADLLGLLPCDGK